MKKKPLPKWLKAIPDDIRPLALEQIKAQVLRLRRLEKGYEASHGYNLRHVSKFSAAKVAKLREKITILNYEISRPHVEYRPQNKQARDALSIYTGKKLTARTKKVIIHTDGRATHISVRSGVVQAVRKSKNADGTTHVSVQRDYLFLYNKPPKNWDEVIIKAAKMVARLPPGMYMVMSSRFAMVDSPTHRDALLTLMQTWYVKYGTDRTKEGMAETLIGFRWVGAGHKQSDKFLERWRDRISDIQKKNKKDAAVVARRVRKLLNKRRK